MTFVVCFLVQKWVPLTNIYYYSLYGKCALAFHVYSTCFGLGHRRYDVLDGVARYIEGRIGHLLGYFFQVISEDEPSCGAAEGFGGYKVSIVGFYVDYHFTCVLSQYFLRLGSEVVHEHIGFCEVYLWWEQIFRLKVFQGQFDEWIHFVLIAEGSRDELDVEFYYVLYWRFY